MAPGGRTLESALLGRIAAGTRQGCHASARLLALWAALAFASTADAAEDLFQASGFALLRAASASSGPLAGDQLSGQVQLGLDWTPSVQVRAHVHLLARSDDGDAENGHAGVVEAFVEALLPAAAGEVRLRGGAMFLPSSYENIDALWETPYTLTPSALNSWIGEELRPIGVDAAYSRGGITVGGTLFGGNDTLGALPPVRGWAFNDRWTLLGEHLPVDHTVATSVSDDTDGRLGWSARLGWQGRHLGLRYTHLDNRSDGLRHGDLYNWNTRLDIAGLEATTGVWTIAAETGWGPTYLVVGGQRFVTDLRASYLLVSRRLPRGRATVRVDRFDDGKTTDDAVAAAYLFTPPGRLGVGIEGLAADDHFRALLQLRWAFSAP